MFKNLKLEITARLHTAAVIDKVIFISFVVMLFLDLVTLNWIGAAIDVAILGYVYWSAGA